MEGTARNLKVARVLVLALAFCLLSFAEGQQIQRPGGGSGGVQPSAAPTPSQAVAAAQYYASAVNQSPPKPIPPPQQQQVTQAQLQQAYLLQQQRERDRQKQIQAQAHREAQAQQQQREAQQQRPQIVYQTNKQISAPPKSNQLRPQSQQPSRGVPARQQPQSHGNSQEQQSFESYEDEEEQEPDRLTILLQGSKFQCTGRKDGYYADEGLACEVFHYCHDNVKHSWMCPNQFMFHQVHLICVPPSGENLCKQSSNFHFVNDYLYRPINVKEVERNQNVSLRYGDRYYPEGYAVGLTPFDDQYLLAGESAAGRIALAPAPTHSQQQHRGKVYYSADSVNIPLSQRRPGAAGPAAVASSRQPPVSAQLSEEEYDYE